MITAEEKAAEIRYQIEKLLLNKPETGEQWADICALEAEAIKYETGDYDADELHDNEDLRPDGQFGAGA